MKLLHPFAAGICSLFLALAPVHAQTGNIKTQLQLNTEIGVTGCTQPGCLYPDNTLGQITPFGLRQGLLDIVATLFNASAILTVGTTPITGGVSGNCLTINTGILGSVACGSSAITSLTGDMTAAGPGAAAATLATVNSNTGTFGGSAAIPVITVNNKGLITAVSLGTSSAVSGPVSSTIGDMAFFNNTLGTVIADAPFSYNPTGNVSGTNVFLNNSRGGTVYESADVTTVSNQFTFGGSAHAGDTITVTLNYTNAVGTARNIAISYVVQGGDTLSSIATGMGNAIIANATLAADFSGIIRFFNPGTVATNSAVLRFNFAWLPSNRGTPTLTFTNNSTGGTPTTITINGSLTGVGSTASNPVLTLDTVPRLWFVREAGVSRPGQNGDIIWQNFIQGNDSSGAGQVFALESYTKTVATAGSISATWSMSTPSSILAFNNGLLIGAATGGDEGVGTVNAAGAYYQNGTIGVTCSGSPTMSFASKLGIVTHC